MTNAKLPAALIIFGTIFVAVAVAVSALPVTQDCQSISYEDENFEAELNDYLVQIRTETDFKESGTFKLSPFVGNVGIVIDGKIIGTFNMSERIYHPSDDIYRMLPEYLLYASELPICEDGRTVVIGNHYRLVLKEQTAPLTFSVNEKRILNAVPDVYLTFTYNGEVVYVDDEEYDNYSATSRYVDITVVIGEGIYVPEEIGIQYDEWQFFNWANANSDTIAMLLTEYDAIAFEGHIYYE